MSPGQNQKLPRTAVLRNRNMLRQAREKGVKRYSRYFTLYTVPKESVTGEKVAFMVPKKAGSAVVRSRLKRRMREIYRRFVASTAGDLLQVWLAKPAAGQADFEALKSSMLELAAMVR